MMRKKRSGQHNYIQGRTSLYNPLLQKPIALHPVGPGSYPAGYGGYSYIGHPPDFGGTYGKFEDTAGREQYGVKASRMFSIFDGSPTQFKAELNPEEREALLTQMDDVVETCACTHCRSELAVSVAKKMDKVFCPHCGSEMEHAVEKVKQSVSKLEEKRNMSTSVEAKAKRAKSNIDLAKEAMKKEAPGMASESYKPKKAEPEDHKEAQKDVVVKDPMKEMSLEAKTELANKKRARMQAHLKSFRTQAQANKDGFTRQELVKMKRDFRIMAVNDPVKFAKHKVNPKFAKICAEVESKLVPRVDRIISRAEIAILAADDAQAAERVKKHLDFMAPEILMEEIDIPAEDKQAAAEHQDDHKAQADAEEVNKAADKFCDKVEKIAEKDAEKAGEATPEINEEVLEEEVAAGADAAKDEKKDEKAAEACGDEKAKEAQACDETAKPAEACDEAAFSMQTEFLASLESLKGEKIEMSLYGEETQDPFWNVTIDGMPVGRVHLQDQNVENPSEIRAAFCNESYAKNFGEAARSVGLNKIMELTKTRLFAHTLDEKEVTARLREKAKTEARAEMDEKLGTLRSDFMDAVKVAMTAADKNFYQNEQGHALKGALWNALVQAGLTEQGAVWAVEAGFGAAPEYFDFIMAKAQEIMDMPKEARESITKQIMASGRIELSQEAPEEESLAQRLVKSSVNVIAMGGTVTGENREKIRNSLGLDARRR